MTQAKQIKYPGTRTTADGAAGVVWVETHITQGGCAYPITSSTTMGEGYELAVANGAKNLWDEPLVFLELESEHSSASACEGYALAGGRVTNFTSGQGLILMKEVLYTISGKRLPAVFHIGARALTSHSLNVHAGHDDVMGVSDCGWGMLFAQNAQETTDLALIARRAAEASYTPYMNVMDGFLTTHTVETLFLPEPELMEEFIGPPSEHLVNLMDPHHPVMSGVVQNQDSYMKGKIAQRAYYDKLMPVLKDSMKLFGELTGRHYSTVESYRMDDADYAIVGMGTMIETAKAVVDYAREKDGAKVGCIHVTSFRPFPGPEIVEALKDVKAFAVLERMDNPPAQSNPLTSEIKAAFADALTKEAGYPAIERIPTIFSGAAGLGSRDIRIGDYLAVYERMKDTEASRYFVLGIDHETALECKEDPDLRGEGTFSMRGNSVGGYGSVTTNKVIATIMSDLFDLHVQAYPKYGSEKKGLPTMYFLTVSENPIRTHNELHHVDFVPVHDLNAFHYGNPLAGLDEGGLAFLQTPKTSPQEVWESLPASARKVIRDKKYRVMAMDTVKVAEEVSSRPDLVQRMQGIVLLGIFLKATPFAKKNNISEEEVFKGVEKSIRKYFGKRGEQVVKDNMEAVSRGYNEVFEIPQSMIAEKAA